METSRIFPYLSYKNLYKRISYLTFNVIEMVKKSGILKIKIWQYQHRITIHFNICNTCKLYLIKNLRSSTAFLNRNSSYYIFVQASY